MGRDKAWLEIEGQPLIARQIRLARTMGASEVWISGRPGVDYGPLGVPVVCDREPGLGPMAGVREGLAAARQGLVWVLAVDLPRMSADIAKRLWAHCRPGMGAIPMVAGRCEPLAGFYPRVLLPIVEEHLKAGRLAMRDLIDAGVARGFLVRTELGAEAEAAFENWNQPSDARGGSRLDPVE